MGTDLPVESRLPWQPGIIPKASRVGKAQLKRHRKVWVDARNDVVGEPPVWRNRLRHKINS